MYTTQEKQEALRAYREAVREMVMNNGRRKYVVAAEWMYQNVVMMGVQEQAQAFMKVAA